MKFYQHIKSDIPDRTGLGSWKNAWITRQIFAGMWTDGDGERIVEERWIFHLPSWGYGYDICSDTERWGRRVWRFNLNPHGKDRFFVEGWVFPDVSVSGQTVIGR
jgi:hypothetical protein